MKRYLALLLALSAVSSVGFCASPLRADREDYCGMFSSPPPHRVFADREDYCGMFSSPPPHRVFFEKEIMQGISEILSKDEKAPPPSLEKLRDELKGAVIGDRFVKEHFMKPLLYVLMNEYCLKWEDYQTYHPSLSGQALFQSYANTLFNQADCFENFLRDDFNRALNKTDDQNFEAWVNTPTLLTYMGFPNASLAPLFSLYRTHCIVNSVRNDLYELQKYVFHQEYQILEEKIMNGDLQAAETLFACRKAYDIRNQHILGVQACLSDTFADFVKIHLLKDMPVDYLRKWAQKYNHPAILSKVREIMRDAADKEFEEIVAKQDAVLYYNNKDSAGYSKAVVKLGLVALRKNIIEKPKKYEAPYDCKYESTLMSYGLTLGLSNKEEKALLVQRAAHFKRDLEKGEPFADKEYFSHIDKIDEYNKGRQKKNTLIERYKALARQEPTQGGDALKPQDCYEAFWRITKRLEKPKTIAITQKVIDMTLDYIARDEILRQALETQGEKEG